MKTFLRAFVLLSTIICINYASAVIIPDFQVNPPDTAFIAQYTTDIAFQPNGNFVVVWEDRGWDHDNRQIYFRRYDSLANPISSPVLVSDTSTGLYNQGCFIATDSGGNFGICYSSAKYAGVDSITGNDVFLWDIWVRLYSVVGEVLSPSIKVDVDRPAPIKNPGGYVEENPHIARHKSGKFVVVWHEESNSETVVQKIFCQFFDSEGNRAGNNIWVSNPDSSEFPISWHYSFLPRVAITDNGFVLICWEGLPSGQTARPLARFYSLNGTSLRKVFTLLDFNDPEWTFGSKPDVDVAPSNYFVVSFNSYSRFIIYPNNAIVVARFDTLGNPLNRPVLVNDTNDLGNVFRMTRVDAGMEGYVVVWSDRRSGDRNFMAQRFDYSDQPIGGNYRINGPSGSLNSPPDSISGEEEANWQFYDLDINKHGKVGVSWSDYRNYATSGSDIYSKVLEFSEIGIYVSGDLNQDGKANITDIIFLVNYVFKSGTKPFPLFLADVNADCKVNLADIIYLVNYIFKGGTAPKQGCA